MQQIDNYIFLGALALMRNQPYGSLCGCPLRNEDGSANFILPDVSVFGMVHHRSNIHEIREAAKKRLCDY